MKKITEYIKIENVNEFLKEKKKPIIIMLILLSIWIGSMFIIRKDDDSKLRMYKIRTESKI